MFFAKAIIVFGRRNKFRTYEFQTKEKAQRFYERCKRKGLVVQPSY